MSRRTSALLITVAIVLILIATAFGIAYLLQKPVEVTSQTQTPVSTPTKFPVSLPVSYLIANKDLVTTLGDGSASLYSSKDLGIEFEFQNFMNNIQIKATRTDNKISLYTSITSQDDGQPIPTDAQSIEKFNKDPSETLAQAVNRTILQGYSSKCFFQYATNTLNYPKTYELGVISILPSYATPIPPSYPDSLTSADCPLKFVRREGINYFIADTANPDKFVFVSIGQYALFGTDAQTPWQKSIRFVK